MKIRKRVYLRIVAGLLLIVLAGGVSYVIKGVLSARQPESALPEMQVIYSDAPLPAANWMMDSYQWRFLTTVQAWEEPNRSRWLDLQPAPVLPGMPLEIDFSFPCQEMEVSRAMGTGTLTDDDFTAVSGSLTTPHEPGVYTYKIAANWGIKGSVLYYVRVMILESY